MCACVCLCVTYLVTLKSGKRILFLMKMVKLFTSNIGLLEEDVDREEGVRVTIKASNVCRCTFCLSVCVCARVCKPYIFTLSFSAGHHPSISH